MEQTFVTADLPGFNQQTVTFHQSKGLGINAINGVDADLMSKVNQAHVAGLQYEKAIMQWIGQSQNNATQFMENPIAAIENSGIDIPAELLQQLKTISAELVATLKK